MGVKRRKRVRRRALLLLPLLAALLIAPLVFLLANRPDCEADDCASVEALRDYRPPEASQVYAADGTLIARLSPQRRVVVDLDEMPDILKDGMVAVEDRRFYEHGGVDYRGVARAAWRDLVSLSFREGFSTITMQLARNVFPEALPRAKQLRRKAWEVILAYRIEGSFSKDEILGLYLNQIYLGDGLYGVEAAAQGYFGKSVDRLSVPEAALLIALPKNPEGYNPRRNPLDAVQRRNLVLAVMAREGVIDPTRLDQYQATPIRLAPVVETGASAPYFVAAVRRELRERFGEDAPILGLRVHTGLAPEVQRAAQRALDEQISRIESGAYGRYTHDRPDGSLEPAQGDGSPFLQGMVVSMDPLDGTVRAVIGGRDFRHSQYDRALQARRQPGSAFKPIVYAAALDAGMSLATRVDVSDVEMRNGGGAWRPSDHVADSLATLPAREALAQSSNSAAVRVGQWVGTDRVISTARSLGLSTPIPPYPSIFLGAAEVVPVELVAAYAAFANGGRRVEPRFILRVEDAEGRVIWSAPPRSTRAMDPGVAYLTLSAMEDVVDRGTGRAVRDAGFWYPAAGKTGTTNDNHDAWFVGATPDLVTGVWLGFDRPRRIVGNAGGGALAAPVWGHMMRRVYEERPMPAGWLPPANVRTIAIDVETGGIATGNCPTEHVRVEHFLPGTEPVQFCPLHEEGGVGRFFERLWRGVTKNL